jgi:hypothetical protein
MKYPIIALKKNDSLIYHLESENYLLITTEKLLKQNVFLNSNLIDSDGFNYNIRNAKKISYIGFFGLNPLLKNWWNDREIKIELEFEPEVKQIDITILKQILTEKVEKSKWFWRASWDIKDLKNAITNAQNYEELIMLFK